MACRHGRATVCCCHLKSRRADRTRASRPALGAAAADAAPAEPAALVAAAAALPPPCVCGSCPLPPLLSALLALRWGAAAGASLPGLRLRGRSWPLLLPLCFLLPPCRSRLRLLRLRLGLRLLRLRLGLRLLRRCLRRLLCLRSWLRLLLRVLLRLRLRLCLGSFSETSSLSLPLLPAPTLRLRRWSSAPGSEVAAAAAARAPAGWALVTPPALVTAAMRCRMRCRCAAAALGARAPTPGGAAGLS
jgi:hypothetical protein